jgi:flagellar biosynthesis GTPase FlhF
MISSFRIEGSSREEILKKLRKMPNHEDAIPLDLKEKTVSGILGIFKKKVYVQSFILSEHNQQKRKAIDAASTTIQIKKMSMDTDMRSIRTATANSNAAVGRLRPLDGTNGNIRDVDEIRRMLAMIQNRQNFPAGVLPPRNEAPVMPAPRTNGPMARIPEPETPVIDNGESRFSRWLMDKECDAKFTRAVVESIRSNRAAADWSDPKALKKAFMDALPNLVNFRKCVMMPDGGTSRKYVMIVGPAGTGKTTTLVKLASEYYMRNISIRFITIDTFRIGAADQLKSFASIMNVPIDIVTSKDDLEKKLAEAREEIIFIDTAGRGPMDRKKAEEFSPYISVLSAKKDDLSVFIACDAGAKRKDLENIVKNFSDAGVTGLIITKTDATVDIGNVLSFLHGSGLPVCFVTNGQDVPADIVKADSSVFTDLIFKEEQEKN